MDPRSEQGHLSSVRLRLASAPASRRQPGGRGTAEVCERRAGGGPGRCRALWSWGGAAVRLARTLGLDSYISIAGLGSPHSSTSRPPALEEKGERNKKGGKISR